MKTVSGVYTSAKIFTDTIEDYALAQIQMLCDNEAFKECRVRVMPDVHPGKAGTIGFTSTQQKGAPSRCWDRYGMRYHHCQAETKKGGIPKTG